MTLLRFISIVKLFLLLPDLEFGVVFRFILLIVIIIMLVLGCGGGTHFHRKLPKELRLLLLLLLRRVRWIRRTSLKDQLPLK